MSVLNRGNKLWEGHRMFLPEHREIYQEVIRKQNRRKKPLLSQDQLATMQYLLEEALHTQKTVSVTIFQPENLIYYQGIITKLDFYHKTFVMVTNNEQKKIPIEIVIEIELDKS